MTATIMSMIIMWCAGARGPVIINEPTPEMRCRVKLIKCYENGYEKDTISSECLTKAMEDL
jgi:hypothetical protein